MFFAVAAAAADDVADNDVADDDVADDDVADDDVAELLNYPTFFGRRSIDVGHAKDLKICIF